MGKDVSFMQYMRAHGNTPSPTERPYLNGAICGLAAEIPAAILLCWSGAIESAARFFGWNLWLTLALDAALTGLAAGVIYALIFKRAANDRSGGWLFGVSYGFLIWMLTPVALWQLITSHAILTGKAAIGLFGARLIYGLFLGWLYPRIHAPLQKKLKNHAIENENRAETSRKSGGEKPPAARQPEKDASRLRAGQNPQNIARN